MAELVKIVRLQNGESRVTLCPEIGAAIARFTWKGHEILRPAPDKAIAEKLGSQKNSWKYVWQLYATAPHKYPEIEALLRLSKPTDLGTGIFALPDESWPQVNEQKEEALALAAPRPARPAQYAKRQAWWPHQPWSSSARDCAAAKSRSPL